MCVKEAAVQGPSAGVIAMPAARDCLSVHEESVTRAAKTAVAAAEHLVLVCWHVQQLPLSQHL